MNKAELDKITELVLTLLEEKGVSISKSGSTQAGTGSHGDPAKAAGERSPFKMDPMLIPVLITGRAVFLTKEDTEKLFGKTGLTEDPALSKHGRVVYRETVTVSGPDGDIEDVHVCAGLDSQSQVELLSGDDLVLGIKAPLRLSGDVSGSPSCRIVGPSGDILLEEGAIIPMRKITLDPPHAEHYGVREGQVVSVEVSGSRGGTLANVAVVVRDGADCVCVLDVNEAGAMCVSDASMVKILK